MMEGRLKEPRQIFTCIAFTLLTFPVADEPKEVSVKTIESAQRFVVPVLCMQANEKKEVMIKKIMGTAFFINWDGYFLTAAHVVLDWKSVSTADSLCFPAIYAPTVAWKDRTKEGDLHWFRFSKCRYNGPIDVAVCKPDENPFMDRSVSNNIRPAQLGSFKKYGDGSPVAFTGFPLESIIPITSKAFIASYFPNTDELAIDKAAWPGASGSPLYDPKGVVIAIITKRGINQGIGLAFARPTDSILDFLRENKIAIEQ